MNTGRSIQDIVPPARSKPIRPHQHTPPSQTPIPPMPQPLEEGRGAWFFIWIAIGALLVAFGGVFLMSTLFHTATIEITLQEWKADVSGTYRAGDEKLPYEVLALTEIASRTVPRTGSVEAKDHASGTILISNLSGTQSQRLITNTRFETQDGKVYRIHAPLTVPGYKIKNGEKIPGTIEATIYADQAGESYNIQNASFKLPGLRGSNQYDLITATTKTAITGGFVGQRATVEKSVRDSAIAEIKAELDRTLRERVAQSPGAVFPASLQVTYREEADKAEGDEAIVSVVGSALAPVFESDALTRTLVSTAGISSDAKLKLVNPQDISFSYVEANRLLESGPITFTLSGTAHLLGDVDMAELAQKLAGKAELEAQTVRAGSTTLHGPMTISIYPFWLSTIPENVDRITVKATGALDLSE